MPNQGSPIWRSFLKINVLTLGSKNQHPPSPSILVWISKNLSGGCDSLSQPPAHLWILTLSLNYEKCTITSERSILWIFIAPLSPSNDMEHPALIFHLAEFLLNSWGRIVSVTANPMIPSFPKLKNQFLLPLLGLRPLHHLIMFEELQLFPCAEFSGNISENKLISGNLRPTLKGKHPMPMLN